MTAPAYPPLPGGGQPHPNPPRLCDPCRTEIARWYDYRAPRPVRFANHADYDETGGGIADNGQARFEQWRATVRYQQDLIRQQCAREHGARPLRIGSLFTGPTASHRRCA